MARDPDLISSRANLPIEEILASQEGITQEEYNKTRSVKDSPTREERLAQLKREREIRAEEAAADRAASNPLFNPTERPEAPAPENGFMFYYSWIGGTTNGEWKLYRAPINAENIAKYGSRTFGGETQADFSSAVGANTLASQPQLVKDEYGNIVGYTKDDKKFGYQGFTGATGTGSGTGSGAGSGAGAGSGSGAGAGAGAGTGIKTTYTAPDGRIFTDLNAYNAYIAQTAADAKRKAGQSAYDLLFSQFQQYGLGALVEPLKQFITDGLSGAEFTLRLRDTDAYKKRFAANEQRIRAGLRALSEAEYIGLEDQYQNVMRNYGLPQSYYTRGDMGVQQGFEKFIAGDVSAAELEDRIQTAQNRVINAAPEVSRALREFYPDITGGDILAYALDPQQALTNIKRKVTAAEIGAGAMQAGLATGLTRAEELQKYGVTGEQARQQYQNIATVLPRASMLGDIYTKQGMGPFTQATAEQEAFGIPGAAEAATKRRKLSELEQASFAGQVGRAGSALARERAGQFQTC